MTYFSYGHDILIAILFVDRGGVVCLYDKVSAKKVCKKVDISASSRFNQQL